MNALRRHRIRISRVAARWVVCLLALGCLLPAARATETETRTPDEVENGGELVDYVVATVNGDAITWRALQLEVRLRNRPQDDPTVQRQVLDSLIDEQLLLQEARNFVIVTDAAVEDEIQRRSQPMSSAEYLDQMASRGIVPAELRERVREQLMLAQLAEREFRPKIEPVSAKDVEAYYQSHPTEFLVPAAHRLQQVLVTLPSNATNQEKQAARSRIEAIRDALASGRESLDDLAREADTDASLLVRADTGWHQTAEFMPELRPTVETLPIGTWSQPITTPVGYFLLRIIEQRLESRLPLNDATRAEIARSIRAKRLQSAMKKWVDRRREQSDIRILDERLRAVKTNAPRSGSVPASGDSSR